MNKLEAFIKMNSDSSDTVDCDDLAFLASGIKEEFDNLKKSKQDKLTDEELKYVYECLERVFRGHIILEHKSELQESILNKLKQ